MANPFDNLMLALSRLPGIGRRSAERIALALVRKGDEAMLPLLEALADVRENVCACRLCGSITTRKDDPCRLCSDPQRDQALLCVVEGPGDIMAIERSGAFNGVYHALHGRISPMSASGPEDIRLAELRRRLEGGRFREVVLALATDVEGDATAAYIAETLAGSGVTVSRLAFGLPADSGVGYSDPVTLKRAINGRQSL
ncbi:MAG: recombination mediator RecR [Kiritimatiellia bacterium]|jgi:recombination protein RecR